ncbi:MAG TPA: glycosyltransferase [Longimicrobiaceae bacterium]
MKLVVFGLSLSSSWGNGHATTYRALLRAFAARGHEVVFYEWDAPWYGGAHRDLANPEFCRLELYPSWEQVIPRAITEAREADATLVGSYVRQGAAVIDALAEAGVDPLFFYDIDTPVTVAQLRGPGADYLRVDQVPLFTRYLSFTGGPWLEHVLEGELGARDARALYCSVDPEAHGPVDKDPEFEVDLAYMGTYAPDRQPVIERLLNDVAWALPKRSFLVAGPQYPDEIRWPANVRRVSHLPPSRHAAFYSSAAWQLNATRADMVAAGWSPSVRLFEAGACGAAILSDFWPGIDQLFVPGQELALPETTEAACALLEDTHPDDRRAMGAALRSTIVAEHSAQRRADELESYLQTPSVLLTARRTGSQSVRRISRRAQRPENYELRISNYNFES